ncbi:TolC family protein [candidate division KSB1 bacterium]|nr:TolC family protein [candidate division KSB1 bacterium]
MRTSLILFILVIFCAEAPSQTRRMSLDDVLSLALKNNIELRRAQQRIVQAKMAVDEARANRYAPLDFKASYSRYSDVMQMKIDKIDVLNTPFSVPGRTIQFGDENEYETSLSVIQPVFTGYRLSSALQAAREDASSREMSFLVQKNQLAFDAQKAFYDLCKVYEMKRIAQASHEQVACHVRDLRNFYEQGLISQNEVLSGEVKLSETELLIIKAENAIELSNIVLLHLLNLDLNQLIEPVYDVNAFSDAADLSLPGAIPNKPEMKMLNFQLAGLQYKQKAVTATSLPGIAVFGSLLYGKPGLDKISNEWMAYWVAGVRLQWNLWDWGRTRAQVQQMQSALNELRLGREQIASGLELDIQRTRIQLKDSRKRLRNAIQTLEAAEENYRIVENMYREGVLANSAYLDAQADLTRARIGKVQSQIDLQIAIADFERASRGAE